MRKGLNLAPVKTILLNHHWMDLELKFRIKSSGPSQILSRFMANYHMISSSCYHFLSRNPAALRCSGTKCRCSHKKIKNSGKWRLGSRAQNRLKIGTEWGQDEGSRGLNYSKLSTHLQLAFSVSEINTSSRRTFIVDEMFGKSLSADLCFNTSCNLDEDLWSFLLSSEDH